MKQFVTHFAAVLTVAVSLFSPPTFAAVVTFDDGPGIAALGVEVNTGVSLSGLSFSHSGFFGSVFGSNPNGNGTFGMIFAGPTTSNFTITRTGGGLFDLSSLELGISWYAQDNPNLDVVINGTTYGLVQGLTTLNLGLVGVSSVEISGFSELTSGFLPDQTPVTGAGYWLMDNINFDLNNNTVPEPGSLALVGLAVLGLVFARRRTVRA